MTRPYFGVSPEERSSERNSPSEMKVNADELLPEPSTIVALVVVRLSRQWSGTVTVTCFILRQWCMCHVKVAGHVLLKVQ